jgi:hypothetical protein
MPLPELLVRVAVRRPSGGISLVAGAGCSFEEPTNIPLARECSEEAFGKLVRDGLLSVTECTNPSDLSALADAVFSKFGSQERLVERLPINAFRYARANDGYLLLAALFREHVISSFATLNFDLVPLKALSDVGAMDEVAVIRGPEEHRNYGARNIVYLHRSVDANPDEWILRTDQLTEAWKGGWEELVALRIVSNPVTIFVGLGTPAAVLLECVKKVRAAVPGGTQIYQVDPGKKEDSAYSQALALRDDEFLQMGWSEFMEALSGRVAAEQGARLISGCKAVRVGDEISDLDIEHIANRLSEAGLLALGKLRAEWMMKSSIYHPELDPELPFLSAVVITIRLIEKRTGTQALFVESPIVEFRDGLQIKGAVAFIIVPGQKWLSVEPRLNKRRRKWRRRSPYPKIIISGAIGMTSSEVSVPESIYSIHNPDDIVSPDTQDVIELEHVRNHPALVFGETEHNDE